MSRYIDAEQFEGMLIVKPVVVEIKLNKLYATRDFTRQDFVKKAVVDDIPTADVQEVKHGMWTTKRTWYHDGETYCSLCDYESEAKHKYCPSCGARMDDKENDNREWLESDINDTIDMS